MDGGEGYDDLELDNTPSLPYIRENGARGIRPGIDQSYGGPTGPPYGPTGPPLMPRRPNDGRTGSLPVVSNGRRDDGPSISEPPMVDLHPSGRSSLTPCVGGVVNTGQYDSRARQGRSGTCYPGTLTEQRQRLRTYINWPQTTTGQTPSDLADAGFYFTAYEDEVECQYCGLVLSTWNPADVPMDEHRKYKPTCPFISQFPS